MALESRDMKKNPSRPFQVVLDIDAGSCVMRDALNGILRFVRDARDWSLVSIDRGQIDSFSTGMVFDGAIVAGRWNARRPHRKALRVRRTVELILDAGSVARLAAEHFRERGFEHCAFVEPPRSMPWANERREAFCRELAARGMACAVYRPPSGVDLTSRHRHLAAWLAAQPRPLAVLGAYDVEARRVLAACRIAGLNVPEDVAVLGIDNDLLRCETALPALSSVAMGGEEAGQAAAAALDAAMRGRPGAPERIILGGVRVEARASTAHFIGRDPLVAKARAAVAARIGERLPVSELAKALGVSRRTLELRFRAETGVPIGEAILNERLARAKDLLRTTSLPCERIAAACGIYDANHLGHLFRRKFGASPSAFRKGS